MVKPRLIQLLLCQKNSSLIISSQISLSAGLAGIFHLKGQNSQFNLSPLNFSQSTSSQFNSSPLNSSQSTSSWFNSSPLTWMPPASSPSWTLAGKFGRNIPFKWMYIPFQLVLNQFVLINQLVLIQLTWMPPASSPSWTLAGKFGRKGSCFLLKSGLASVRNHAH